MRGTSDEQLGNVFGTDCPERDVLDHVTSRWGTLVIAALCRDELRFFQLRDRIGGISEKMLAQNLRTLERDGLVERLVEPTRPPQVSYRLTDLGLGLAAHLQALVGWIGENTTRIQRAQRRYDSEQTH